MYLRPVRTLALLLGAICSVVVPCAPALAGGPGCGMSGCDDGPGLSAPMPCCCAAQAPAGASTSGSPALPAPAAAHHEAAPDSGSGRSSIALVTPQAAFEISPLYIRHSALLM